MAGIFKRRREDHPQFYATVGEGLKKIYRAKLLPLEEAYEFQEFVSPPLNDPDFDAKPMILFVGQYSTGKTSLIRYLLERDYPGIRIGPEPTTDVFNVVMYGDSDQVIPGNALAVDNKKPLNCQAPSARALTALALASRRTGALLLPHRP